MLNHQKKEDRWAFLFYTQYFLLFTFYSLLFTLYFLLFTSYFSERIKDSFRMGISPQMLQGKGRQVDRCGL